MVLVLLPPILVIVAQFDPGTNQQRMLCTRQLTTALPDPGTSQSHTTCKMIFQSDFGTTQSHKICTTIVPTHLGTTQSRTMSTLTPTLVQSDHGTNQ